MGVSIGLFAPGEATAPDLCDPADNEKAVRVNAPGQTLQLGVLVVADHGEQNLRGISQVATLAVENGNPPIHLGQNDLPDGFRLLRDNLDLRPAAAQKQHPIQEEGNDQNQQNKQDNKDQDKGQNQNNSQDQNNNQGQNQNGQSGQQPVKISPQQAQQMLKAIQAKEKETQDKVNREKAEALKSRQKEKNW